MMKMYLVNFVGYEDDDFGFDHYYIFSTYEEAKHCILQMYHYYKTHSQLYADWMESEEDVTEEFEHIGGIEDFAYIEEIVNPTFKPANG